MAVKQKASAKRRKVVPEGPKRAASQPVAGARRKTKSLRQKSATAVENAGGWVGDGVKRRSWAMAIVAAAVGMIGWVVGWRSSK